MVKVAYMWYRPFAWINPYSHEPFSKNLPMNSRAHKNAKFGIFCNYFSKRESFFVGFGFKIYQLTSVSIDFCLDFSRDFSGNPLEPRTCIKKKRFALVSSDIYWILSINSYRFAIFRSLEVLNDLFSDFNEKILQYLFRIVTNISTKVTPLCLLQNNAKISLRILQSFLQIILKHLQKFYLITQKDFSMSS